MMVPVDPGLTVELVSPPDRHFLVAAIMLEGQQLAEVNVEKEDRVSVEIYSHRSGTPWNLDIKVLQDALTEAARLLQERTRRG